MDKKALIEAAKEFLRYAVFALLSFAVTFAIDYLAKLNLSPEVLTFLMFVLTNLGRIADKYKYISSREALTSEEVKADVTAKGLLPF